MHLSSHSLRSLTATALTALLLLPFAFASPDAHPRKLTKDQRVLHALNRFTFGPTPGEVRQVERIGLNRWFEQQLNPAVIDDSALESRLDQFPAMRLSQQELFDRYPSPQRLRVIERQNLPLPADPIEHAIYADQIAFYNMRMAAKAAKDSQQGKDGSSAKLKPAITRFPDDILPPDPTLDNQRQHEEQLYADLDAVRILNLPPDQRFHRLLSMKPAELIAFRSSLNRQELAAAAQGLSPEQREVLASLSGSDRMISNELVQSRLLRDIDSNRQLEAVMTDFWLNHFNIFLHKNQNEPFLLPTFERDVIRPHALGKFEDLLVATAESPAMLVYLDNWQSTGADSVAARNLARRKARNPKLKGGDSGLNENYGRELMELHTLGVNGGYTQADVIQVAKVLTGWTIDRPLEGATFRFAPNRHEPGPKTVLGKTIQPGGQQEGLEVLHMLATSPATARHISTELAVRFVSDNPPSSLVNRMTRAYLASDGDIKVVLRTLFRSPEFWSPSVYRAKVKTPLEFVVSAARASGANVVNAQVLSQQLNRLGMPLYGMQTPNGYSWKAEPWVNTGDLVGRMNFALQFAAGHIPGTQVDWPRLLEPSNARMQRASLTEEAADPATVAGERQLEMLLLGEPVSNKTRATVLSQIQQTLQPQRTGSQPNPAFRPNLFAGARSLANSPEASADATMAGLLLGSPEFQRR